MIPKEQEVTTVFLPSEAFVALLNGAQIDRGGQRTQWRSGPVRRLVEILGDLDLGARVEDPSGDGPGFLVDQLHGVAEAAVRGIEDEARDSGPGTPVEPTADEARRDIAGRVSGYLVTRARRASALGLEMVPVGGDGTFEQSFQYDLAWRLGVPEEHRPRLMSALYDELQSWIAEEGGRAAGPWGNLLLKRRGSVLLEPAPSEVLAPRYATEVGGGAPPEIVGGSHLNTRFVRA